MSSKRVRVREYTVRTHERVIHARTYKFICQQCHQATARQSYGPMPLFCDICRPPKPKKRADLHKKKRPRPVLLKKADSP